MADTLTGDIGSDRAAFAIGYAITSLVSRDPHVTGDPAEYDCFTRVCESAVCFKIFINRILVNMTSCQRNQTGIRV